MQSGAMTLVNTRTEIANGANTLAINADGSLNVNASISFPSSMDVNVLNFPASQAVTGPLTDAELRNTPVPVSMSPLTQAVKLATSGNYTYVGKAAIGSLGSASVWQIQRIDQTSGLVIEWADGNANFDNKWNDYLILSYS
jgi:hypothetical protein